MNPLVKGKVAGGNRLGRTLGFPTANIPLKEDDPVRNGVYAARVRIDGTEYSAQSLGMNIVVYDKKRRRVVDSVAFNTYADLSASRKDPAFKR